MADSLKVQLGKSDLPDGYAAGIHRFGEKAAFNLTSKYYCYDDPNKGTYVFFKNEDNRFDVLRRFSGYWCNSRTCSCYPSDCAGNGIDEKEKK